MIPHSGILAIRSSETVGKQGIMGPCEGQYDTDVRTSQPKPDVIEHQIIHRPLHFYFPSDIFKKILEFAAPSFRVLHQRSFRNVLSHIRVWVRYEFYLVGTPAGLSAGDNVYMLHKEWYTGERWYTHPMGYVVSNIQNIHLLFSQLNGNQGSWTNTDDLAAPYGQRRVRQVEARNNALVEPQVHERRPPGRNPGNNPRRLPRALARDRVHLPDVVNEPPQILKQQVFSYDWFDIDGRQLACWFDGKELCECRHLHADIPRVLAGTVVRDIVEVGEGWVYTKEDGKDRVPRHMPRLLDTIVSPDLKINGVFFPAREYSYFVPLYSRLTKDFPIKTSKTDLMETLMAYAIKYFSSANLLPYVETTVTAYVHISYLRIHKLQQDHMVAAVANNLEVIAQLDSVYQSSIIREGLLGTSVISNGVVARIDSETYELRDRYLCRSDYELNDPNNIPIFTEDYEPDEDGGTISPRFLIDDLPSHQFRTCFFDIRGNRQGDFVEYKNSLTNLAAGLSRMLKARPQEELFRGNQSHLWGRIGVEIDNRYVGYGGVTPEDYNAVTNVLKGRNYHGHDMAIPSVAWTFVAKAIVQDLESTMHYEYLTRFRDSMVNVSAWGYNTILEKMLTVGAMFGAREAAADINHVKRELRRSYIAGVKCHEPNDYLTRRMEANVKREVAKYGKAPRLFVSYGAGCMYANELPEFVKCCQHGMIKHELNGKVLTVFTLAKPKETSMSELFRLMVSFTTVPNSMFVMIYGDDQVYIDCTDPSRPVFYNVDISSNDSNQDICVLGVNGLALSQFNREWACGLLSQLMLPVQFGPTRHDTRNHSPLTINFRGPFMGSGTVLTTSTNNWGSRLIALATFHRRVMGQLPFEDAVVQGAAMAGHSVTCEKCEDIEQIQFLKISPVRATTGEIIPMRNIGSIIRNLGKCINNLEHVQVGLDPKTFAKLSFDERMEMYVGVTIAGYVNEPSNLILDAFRRRFLKTCVSATNLVRSKDSELELKEDNRSRFVVDEESCARRYGCDVEDIRALANMFEYSKLGDVIVSDLVAKIFSADYGVKNVG